MLFDDDDVVLVYASLLTVYTTTTAAAAGVNFRLVCLRHHDGSRSGRTQVKPNGHHRSIHHLESAFLRISVPDSLMIV